MPKQKNDARSSRVNAQRISIGRIGAAAPLLLAACSGDVINLGEREDGLSIPPHSRCQGSTTLEGPVKVESQEQLDALEGCEVIAGDVEIVAYPGANLRSLYALVRVEGDLDVGVMTPPPVPEGLSSEAWTAHFDNYAESIREWLTSLEGLERLEAVDSLSVTAPVSSLQPLSGLRHINTGQLSVSSGELETLAGLEAIRGVDALFVEGAKLRDISAVLLPENMRTLSINAPIEALAARELKHAGSITLAYTLLEDLNALENLGDADSLYIVGNGRLRDMDGLRRIGELGELVVQENAALERMGDFPALTTLDSLRIEYNDNLTALPSFPNYYPGEDYDLSVLDRGSINVERIEIRQNHKLRHLVMPAGWRAANFVMITISTVESIDFANMESIGSLVVTYNDLLAEVNLGALATVGQLDVYENAVLPLTEFDGIRSFESRISQRQP